MISKKSNGAKYTINNIKEIRSSIISSQLFYKNDEVLYKLNIPNSIQHIRIM